MLYERFQQIVSECTDPELLISEKSWDKEEGALQWRAKQAFYQTYLFPFALSRL